ncbi:MAG: hypothetical protein R2747_16385 [Pyrinomonadaceae bacterium]
MTESVSKGERFLDEGVRIYEFYDEFLVVCPKCGALARVVPVEIDWEKFNDKLFAPRRLICSKCVCRKNWNGRQISVGGNFDWYFRLPLWLAVPCGGETLWAYNREHLELIEDYVSAKLRERTKKGGNSFLSRLPKWIKAAKNRDQVLKAIGRLKGKITDG